MTAEHQFEPNTYIQRVLATQELEIDDELIVVDIFSDRSFRLNATGRYVWRLLQQPRTLSQLGTEMARDFGVSAEKAQAVVAEYVPDLARVGLVTALTHAPSEGGEEGKEEEDA